MVWNQYVWEATTGNEVDWSDDENVQNNNEPLHIDDWIDFNSGELEYLWVIIQETVYDSGSRLFEKMMYEDFARFCFDPPEYQGGVFDVAYWIDTHEDELAYIWKQLKCTKSKLIYQTTFETFAHFCYRFR